MNRKTAHRTMPRPFALAAGAALLLHTPAASAPAPALTALNEVPGFEDQFAPFDAVPEETITAPDAVDLATIDPPVEASGRALGNGVASYYGRKFHGRLTANGERFDMHAMTAAHKTLPFGSKVRVTNPANGKSVVVRINDRGPFTRDRTIDLSRAAAERLGLISRGHGTVELELVS